MPLQTGGIQIGFGIRAVRQAARLLTTLASRLMDLSLLLAIALIVALVVWLNRRQGRPKKPYRRRTSEPTTAPTRPVRSRTERELLRLVGGNRAVADRLVEQVQLRNPQHSEQWCWEKAIYDIQRDRHSS